VSEKTCGRIHGKQEDVANTMSRRSAWGSENKVLGEAAFVPNFAHSGLLGGGPLGGGGTGGNGGTVEEGTWCIDHKCDITFLSCISRQRLVEMGPHSDPSAGTKPGRASQSR